MARQRFDSTHWSIPPPSQIPTHHAHHHLSRRAFIGSMAGAAGAAVGAGLFPTTVLAKKSDATPKPTTNTVTLNGVTFAVTFFGPGVDPASITDFNGLVGVADVQGTGKATHPDGSTETLLFDTDVRFMSGVYVGKDGEVHKGQFGFVWLDLYRGQFDFTNFSTQVHDFDPGIHPYPGGLFWTQTGTKASQIDIEDGRARMTAEDLPESDFFNLPNALFRFQVPVSASARVSFDIHWSGPVTSRGKVTTPGSSGELVMCNATMTWSAHNSLGFRFKSHPSGTTSAFAQLGRVRNGIFFEGDD